ncbi:dihydrolipoyl dehydrogenase [Salibacterium halotolerans]|uniref:Dihydrolipoyl dehydrogenase n=1 Tax=Salibacterium halotolerans TaxID=1884432 RepID=A0A1I5TE97_9BACI|nr:dihydrolipoyl dehydrogenase [Salibacterium halotolerans]SFP81385.1 dihydrolipoamide dehydrogenase [Salibacterium halotolerans]
MHKYDIIIIGSGPGGYVAALRAAKEGKKTAVVEDRGIGGTCLHRGCIPSKTMLQHAEVLHQVEQSAAWGIETGNVSFSYPSMLKQKETVVSQLEAGITALMKKGKIDVIHGFGTVNDNKEVTVEQKDENVTLHAPAVIAAAGTSPFVPPVKGLRETAHVTSDTIFEKTELPSSLLIVGGGVVGVEYACLFAGLHVDVTIVEMQQDILAGEDKDAAALLRNSLEKQGVTVETNAVLDDVDTGTENAVTARYTDKNGITKTEEVNDVLVTAGRRPNNSLLEETSVQYNDGFIQVNENMETRVPGLYVIGDLADGGWKLAHAASAEGISAVEHACGLQPSIHTSLIPRCIYTFPEIASVGMTEEEARKTGYDVKTEVIPMQGNGKAMAMGAKEGFTKIIADKKHGEILGAVLAGPHVTEMIGEAAAYIHLEGTIEELASMVHPHPTLLENLFEAAHSWLGREIHH